MKISLSAGRGQHRVLLSLLPAGKDLVAVISGGNRPHVGSVAVAIPRPSLKNPARLSATSSTFTLVGHKDDEIAKEASEELARELNRVVVVSVGIHLSNASETDIQKLMQNAKRVVEKAITVLKNRETKTVP
ncbi:MAG: proteasome assembly chaperone 4 family protein [Candidatus Hadarchaeum sp.]|uniref:proteasome assembly chaperone 4 family protein n=1 Tax=Candidatus Hadarchaeum sp. TaxID=2883567 RepID=UPI003D149544